MQVIRNVLPVLGNDITTIILNAVSTLFLSIDRDKRLKLCCLLDALAEVDPSIHALVIHGPFMFFILLFLTE